MKVEIKRVGPKSAFKSTMYCMLVVIALLLVIVVLPLFIIALVLKDSVFMVMALPYVLMPIVMVPVYGGIAALMAGIYNKLAKRFGGLKVELDIEALPAEVNQLSVENKVID